MADLSRYLGSFLRREESTEKPLTMSDAQILEQIYETHVHSDIKFDVDSLFILVENILKRSTHIVDSAVQGSQGSPVHFADKVPLPSFSSPLCTLKQISSEMCCKPPGEETAHKTTLSILSQLSHYPWDAKAVLTLAAFALEYGEFWLLSQFQLTDPLAKSLAVLKRVPVLTKPAALKKYQQAIVELNNLIKATLQVIEVIFELEKLTAYDTKDVPALAPAIEQIPVDVYWAIITIVAVVTQIDCLTTESEHRQELSHFGQKINITLSKLRKQIADCKLQIEEVEYYRRLKKIIQTPTEIMQVFRILIFSADDPQPLFDGATKKPVNIDVLRRKNVFLFISTLDITEEEIAVLRPIHDSIKYKEDYKIVWIPIVEVWNEQLRRQFDFLKSKMPWYAVQHFEPIKGYKFIKEEWHFKKKPMVVVMNPQGKVEHSNAFHLIEVWGMKAFPFTNSVQETLDREISWVGSVAGGIHPDLDDWIKKQKYIFFYGGNDKDWIQQFTKCATSLANDPILKEAKISIELFCMEKEGKSLISKFWSGIESLFVTKVHKTLDAVTQEVQKMLSYKNETGWALLCKGSSVVLSGHGTTILKAVVEFEKWKEFVVKKGFELSFREYHEKIVRATHRCSHLEIPNIAGKLPETINCPDCPRKMEIVISYKCCHKDNNVRSATS